MNLVRTLLFLALTAGATACDGRVDAGNDGGPDAAHEAGLDANSAIQCGPGLPACPAEAPICYNVRSHDGSGVVAAQCEAYPPGCESTPTCDCYTTYWQSADAGAHCPGRGPIFCSGDDGGVPTAYCSPP